MGCGASSASSPNAERAPEPRGEGAPPSPERHADAHRRDARRVAGGGHRRTTYSRGAPAGDGAPQPPLDATAVAMRHVMRANALVDEGQLLQAVQMFAEAVTAKTDYAPAYYGRACTYQKLGEHEKAVSNFTCAIQYKADYGVAFAARAAVYLELEEHELAVEDASEAIRLNADDVGAYKVRAAAYQALGDTDLCFDDYEAAGTLESKRLCVICMENPRASRLHPCMHAALCMECANDLAKKRLPCPICAEAITTVESGKFDTTWSPEEAAAATGGGINANPMGTPTRPSPGNGAPSPDSPLHLPPTPPLEARLQSVVEEDEFSAADVSPAAPAAIAAVTSQTLGPVAVAG